MSMNFETRKMLDGEDQIGYIQFMNLREELSMIINNPKEEVIDFLKAPDTDWEMTTDECKAVYNAFKDLTISKKNKEAFDVLMRGLKQAIKDNAWLIWL